MYDEIPKLVPAEGHTSVRIAPGIEYNWVGSRIDIHV